MKCIKYDSLLVNFSTAIAAATSNHVAEKLRQVEKGDTGCPRRKAVPKCKLAASNLENISLMDHLQTPNLLPSRVWASKNWVIKTWVVQG